MQFQKIEHLPLLNAFDKASRPSTRALERWETLADYLRTTLELLDTPSSWLLDNLSAIPTPEKYNPKKWGPPRAVSQGTLSNWLHKREKMPDFRMAAAIALLELRYLMVRAELDATGRCDEFTNKRLELALEQHAEIAQEPALAPYLFSYHLAIYDRLKKDRDKSAAHKSLFQSYHICMPPTVIRAIERQTAH